LYKATGEALVHIVASQEKKNARLKKMVAKLKVTLNPKPLFAEPLFIVVPSNFPSNSSSQNSKLDNKATTLLNGIRDFVTRNIKRSLDLIFGAWEIVVHIGKVT
jgi:hypothetical protein